jgi:antitoxin ParD1/3/4
MLNISLTPKQEALVMDRVHSGRYDSVDDVVGYALRLLEDKERERERRMRQLHEELSLAYVEIGSGDTRVFDKSEVERLKAECRDALALDEK